MKFTLSSLKKFLSTSANLEEICAKLTAIGLEVEGVEDKAKNLAPFSVAKILEAKPHENSTKLKICTVETCDSASPLQIICGASNARTGLKVAYAPIGSTIPANGMVIKKAKIAGIESNGMLCSARELGLGGEDSGIIEIDEKFLVGTKIAEIFGVNDAVIEINVTPNRGDCLGVFGIARDLAASGIGELKTPTFTKLNPSHPFPLRLPTTNYQLPIFFRHLKNLKNCESPKWLKDELEAVGMNSISAIVDVTNYVMLVLNRPLHAYDASKIKGEINIRFAKENEKFTSLKDEEYALDEKTLVISDEEKLLGVAGVIGSKDSACNLQTNEIILESAFFSPSDVAYSGRKLAIHSDARHRFERGIDEASCEDGINFASQLILEICGGEPSEIKTIGEKSPPKKIEFNFAQVKKLTGIEISEEAAKSILTRLGFIIENNLVQIPSHRHDIFASEDLVEEIIRIHGYNQIKSIRLRSLSYAGQAPLTTYHLPLTTTLASLGLTEVINWSFVDSNLVKIFGEEVESLTLANPISAQMNHMRPTLAIGLIESYKRNSLRGFVNLSFFETGNVFLQTGQKPMICGLRAGKNKEQNHFHDERDFDIFDVKKDFLTVAKISGLRSESLQLEALGAPKYYHPHRSAAFKLGKNTVGFFGELHPAVAKKFELKQRINLFEIFVDTLPNQPKSSSRKAYIQNDLPIVERDFAFLINKEQMVGELVKTVANADKQLIHSVNIFDIFSGKNIAEDKKSVALRVKIQPLEKTLTSEEIDLIGKRIIDSVSQKHGATLREI